MFVMQNKRILQFEHHSQPLLSRKRFYRRMLRHAGFGLLIIMASLGIGTLGYHLFEGLSWLDSILNASMILGGMGPVNSLETAGGKIFASCYALFSGIVFLATVGVIIAPMAHRILHRMHLDETKKENESG